MKKHSLLLVLLVLSLHCFAQRSKEERRAHHDSLMTKWNTRDTNYVRMYPDRFIFTWSASYREYTMDFTQTMSEDTLLWSKPIMKGSTSTSYGGAIDFDKISFSFGLGAKDITDDQLHKLGSTKYSAYNLSFCAWRFRVESNYRHLRGMYDTKTPVFDTSFQRTGVYWQNPSMSILSLRVKTLFIFNKRHFSYNSAYYNTQRQLKSSGSWLIVNNLYDYKFTADSSFLAPQVRPFYKNYAYMNFFNVQGISLGPGYSYNLVIFKTLYFNFTTTSLFDIQHRDYKTVDGGLIDHYWHVGYAGDLRLALGLNGKRMFASLTGRWDTNNYLGNGIRMSPTYLAVDFNLGYRFRFKERNWVKKMKANKWYQMM
ncbi:MAG TPA: DUF4421 family protein [Bacteroidia bacterium]|nr:DUF4421 family protein [Bacteroidia bacterium]